MHRDFAAFSVFCVVFIFISAGLTYGMMTHPDAQPTTLDTARGANFQYRKAPLPVKAARIAVVQPIFTDTAYNNAFYVFYAKYGKSNQTYITTDLNYLNVTVKHGWGWSSGLYNFLSSDNAKQQGLDLGRNVAVIDEVNVTNGGLFSNGKRVYDVLILGFTEYVTNTEYHQYKDFVSKGGTIILMDACNFHAEVKYHPSTSINGSAHLSLVKGHGWEFNGTHAWKSVPTRWPDENRNWIGSNYWHWWFGRHYDYFIANTSHPISTYLRGNNGYRIASFYGAHEENLLQNLTNTGVIGYWHLINPSEGPNSTVYPGQRIAAYQHRYMNGSVFHAGIMASDRVSQEGFLQAFLVSAVRMGLTALRDPSLSASIDFYDASGARRDSNAKLSGMISSFITLNSLSTTRGGTTYNLSKVVLMIYSRSDYAPDYTSYPQLVTVQATKIDSTGLRWQAIVDTTSIPDGEYAFEFDSSYVSTVDNESSISQLLVFGFSSIANHLVPPDTVLFVVLASVAVAILLTYVLFEYRRDAEKKSMESKRGKAKERSQSIGRRSAPK